MKSALSQWLRQARERLPEPQLLLVPGHYFFTQRFEIPPGMSREEVDAFLALSLEGSAPFPLDQLAWGYIHFAGESHALVYATARQRLRALGETGLETFYHAFPGFITRLGQKAERAMVRYLSQNGAVSALYFPAGSRVPEKVISRPIHADILTDDALLEAREELDDAIDTSAYYVEEGLWAGESVEINAKGQPVFTHRRLGAETDDSATHTLDRDQTGLWALDLRDPLFAASHLRERNLANRLWTAIQVMAAIILLLFLLQFGAWALSRATGWIDQQFLARYAAADQINTNKQFIERLATDSAQSLDPVRMLNIVNDVRPDKVFFRNAGASKSEDGTTMELRCEGECREGAGTVDAYADTLRALDPIAGVNHQVEIRDGRTFFEMTVTFDPARLASMRPRVTPNAATNPAPVATTEPEEDA